jgi:hypothetical protein
VITVADGLIEPSEFLGAVNHAVSHREHQASEKCALRHR